MKKRLTIDLQEKTHTELKTKCSSMGLIMRELIESLIAEWLKEPKTPAYMKEIYETDSRTVKRSTEI